MDQDRKEFLIRVGMVTITIAIVVVLLIMFFDWWTEPPPTGRPGYSSSPIK